MGIIDQTTCPRKTGAAYIPEPHASELSKRWSLRLGEAAGLTQFGVNLVTVEPGGRSSIRHWHQAEDEFVIVTEGELVLVQDEGEHPMRHGDCAAWKAGDPNGHCLLNRTDRPARFLVVGSKAPREVVTYSDLDMVLTLEGGKPSLTRKDGSPWDGVR